ncbi:MAG: altronate dehydratase family protein [Clostridiales bacterium]|nr:altronate dehydratase [Clostridiales bacterium]MDU3242476.1 altronate dehydratase family protein [Clostridiales bacterium]
MQDYIRIHQNDTVAVALKPLQKGMNCILEGAEVILNEDIMQGHKFALKDMGKGGQVIKYGCPIGLAKEEIKKGDWVHTHNIQTGLGELLDYTYQKEKIPVTSGADLSGNLCQEASDGEPAYFEGYKREDGKVGIRNEIWIIPTVGCVNNVAAAIERKAQKYVQGSIDAVAAFPHPYGCSQMGEDQENTRKILADLVNHPNAGGVLVLGLGCENSNIEELKKYIGGYNKERVRFLTAQDCADEIEESLALIEELAEYAGRARRERTDARELVIGMKCGGSDGLSGITANPVVGAFSDMLIGKGGTTILTEVPEMFGAETLLMNRCRNRQLFDQTVELINDFKNYFTSHNQTIYENPSPGNKKGGISTLEDKSLGCTQKSGKAEVAGVLAYGERVEEKGLNLLSAPGNDLVASTALAASGAHIVLFTTGRGTPFASPVPTVKISSNTDLSIRKDNWIDFNCGKLVEGKTLDEMAEALFGYVLDVASGKQVKAEKAGFHDMAIFKQGVTL